MVYCKTIVINNVKEYFLSKAHIFLDLEFDELLGRKSMEIDFEYTENPRGIDSA